MILDYQRQDQIFNYLKEKTSATVKELAAAMYVSDATIRRDLIGMQNLGLIKRTHGGVVLLDAADEISLFVRITEHAKEKEAAATKALRYLPAEFRTVFLDSSSTVLALAQRMNLTEKTVMTNNLQTAIMLSKIKGINLLIPGGAVSATGASVAGSWTNAQLSDFRFDLMLSSCAALDCSCAYETSLEQREIKRTVFEHSAFRMLVAGHSKFSAKGAYCLKELSAFDRIVLDEIGEEERKKLEGLPVY